ncbi:hypothetical protein HDU67_004688 [Dinochytrium kinnereticum]|nr:hypothetical protein HDU67_004688 [Dinochytrium kinnereticum]
MRWTPPRFTGSRYAVITGVGASIVIASRQLTNESSSTETKPLDVQTTDPPTSSKNAEPGFNPNPHATLPMRLIFRGVYLGVLFTPLALLFPVWYLLWGRRLIQNTDEAPLFSYWWIHLLTATLEKAGPLWIKLAQWGSSRSDALPDGICKILGRLRCHVTPHSFEYTRKILGELPGAFGEESLLECFSELEEQPVGVGAVSQVYKATLNKEITKRLNLGDGVVAIKVLHPAVDESIFLDSLILRGFGRFISRLQPSLRYLAVNEELITFSSMIERQLDLRLEARNLDRFGVTLFFLFKVTADMNVRRFKRNFEKENIPVIFPAPVHQLGSRTVLVETFHEGLLLSSFIEANPTVFDEDLSQIADLHPGNALVSFFRPRQNNPNKIPAFEKSSIISTRDIKALSEVSKTDKEAFRLYLLDLAQRGYKPVVIALDVGMVSELTAKNAQNLSDVFTAAVNGDGNTVADLMMSRCRDPSEVIDADGVRRKMRDLLKDVSPKLESKEKVLPLSQLHSAQVVYRAANLFREHRIGMDGDWISLFVASALIEGIGRKLNADLDLFEVLADELK